MATSFCNCEEFISIDFLEGKKTVTSSYYEDVLKKLKTKAKKRRGKLHSQILFYHDNAPDYSLRAVRSLLCEF